MTKVEHTKSVLGYLIGSPNPNATLVTDAELVLVECEEVKHAILHNIINKGGKFYKPILISRTEKIEVGDWVWSKNSIAPLHIDGKINTVEMLLENHWFKILALPEHFSSQQLQDIVDGKLKEGKCLVECERNCDGNCPITDCDCINKIIKLNPHITIYPVIRDLKFYENNCQDDFASTPISVLRYITELEEKLKSNTVEEKMYNSTVVIEALWKYGQFCNDMECGNDYTTAKQWFEQNIK